MDEFHEMFQESENALDDFLYSEKLSDVTLIHPVTKATYK